VKSIKENLYQQSVIQKNIHKNNKSFDKEILSLKKENEKLISEIDSIKKESTLLKTSFVTLAQDMSLITEALSQIFSLSTQIPTENVESFEEEYNDIDLENNKKKNKKKIYH